jgi:hypothetical protein
MGPSFQRERNYDRRLLITRDPSPFLAPLEPSRRFGDPYLHEGLDRLRPVASHLSNTHGASRMRLFRSVTVVLTAAAGHVATLLVHFAFAPRESRAQSTPPSVRVMVGS